MVRGILLALLLLQVVPPPEYQESIEVRLHNVDVVVTDAAGNPVTGLKAEDFELLEDGTPQTITNFEAVDTRAKTPATPVVMSDGTVAQPQSDPFVDTPPRTFVFFIDEMSLTHATVQELTKNLEQFVMQLQPNDVAAVTGPHETSLKFTSNRDEIAAQVKGALTNADVTIVRKGYESDFYWFSRELRNADTADEKRDVARRWAGRTRARARQRIGVLRGLIASMAPADGRKALIAVTQSLPAVPGRELFEYAQTPMRGLNSQTVMVPLDTMSLPPSKEPPRDAFARQEAERKAQSVDFTEQIKSISRMASSNGVTLYMIRPENDLALRDVGIGLTESKSTPDNPQAPDLGSVSLLMGAVANTTSAMTPMVDITGGRQFMANEKPSDVVRQISNDLSAYYSLAYHGAGGIDKPHKVQVRVRNQPALKIRARSEVERKSPTGELSDQVVASLVRGDGQNALGIRVRATLIDPKKPQSKKREREISPFEESHFDRSRANSFAPNLINAPRRRNGLGSGRRAPLTVEVLIPMGALQFEQRGDTYYAYYNAHYAVTNAANEYVSGVDLDREIAIPKRDWEKALRSYWTHVITVRGVSQDSRIAVGVMDRTNDRTGIATMTVEQVIASDAAQEKAK